MYIDWARGLAVLLMLAWHTADSWTRAADRHSAAFRDVLLLGGFAAPLFLWLAGLAVALSAARLAAASGARGAAARAVVQRGLEIFILAFLFRLQAFIISPGSYPITIFRVDILNIMGLAIVAAGLVWALIARAGLLLAGYALAAAKIALFTPVLRTAESVSLLPQWFQWYDRPAGDLTTFTMFPWAGFVFAGAGCGVLLAGVNNDRRAERRLQMTFAVIGFALLVLGQYLSTRPSIYRESSFWTSSPTWFAMRVGILMIGVAAIYALAEAAARWNFEWRALARFGRSSLFVYWIHIELVYGYASRPLRGRLPIWAALVACAAFGVLMYAAVVFRDRIAENWRARPRARSAPQTATA